MLKFSKRPECPKRGSQFVELSYKETSELEWFSCICNHCHHIFSMETKETHKKREEGDKE